MLHQLNDTPTEEKSSSQLSLSINVVSPHQQSSESSVTSNPKQKNSLLQRFFNLPIGRKQWIALLASELVSIVGIGIVGTFIITNSLRSQLVEQAKSEAIVTDINYNIKVNQMGFGFRGQSDNVAIIQAAQKYTSGTPLDAKLKAEVKQILVNEIKARKIEYATLVSKDYKIIVNANANREGEVFNPSNLVSEVFKNPQQIKATRIVSWSELNRESPPLPTGLKQQDLLIRYTVTPVKNPNNQEVIGALISGDIVNGKDTIVKSTLKATGDGYSAIYLRQPMGEFALATALEKSQSADLNQQFVSQVELPEQAKNNLLTNAAQSSEGKIVTGRIKIGKNFYTVAAKAIPDKIIEEADKPRIIFGEEPVAILVRGTPETTINKILEYSLIAEILIVLIALAINSIWAVILRRTIITPIEDLEETAQKFANGDRAARSQVFAHDEVGQLAVTFNNMADSITAQASHQENEARLALKLNEITASLRETLNSEQILTAAVGRLKEVLAVDRALVYQLQPNWQSKIIAESVSDQWLTTLGANIVNPYLARESSVNYEVGTVEAVDNIYQTPLSQFETEQLERFAVRAYLLAPIFVNKQLYGLLAVHQCSSQRQWQNREINLLKQVAIQVGFAIEQAELLRQLEQRSQKAEITSIDERQQKEALQQQILYLLNDIEGVHRGDLTVRADITQGELSAVAEFFNSIVTSLSLIVTKVKESAHQVNEAIASNESAISQLAKEALDQAVEINHIQDAIDQMTNSIQSIAISAQKAAIVAENASRSAMTSEQAMDLTVNTILGLKETINETVTKVKRLGESNQEIARVVSLINEIALQTNLLAINAGIEAGRSGDENQGFAIIAEEVGSLAARSAFATQEVEQIVTNIQLETQELVHSIEQGSLQVMTGARIVTDAKQSLNQILDVSHQVDSLVQSISTATISQVETSSTINQLIKQIAAVSQRTSTSSRSVSQSLQQTVEISQDLQETVETFKVN
jgi:twitching motility protein PilJ